MTFTEADKIFQVWSQWHWPFHSMLYSIFSSNIPESFLPYPLDDLNEAITIMANHYNDVGDQEFAELVYKSIGSLSFYKKDDYAFGQASENMSNSEIRETMLIRISKYKKDWINFINKQEN